MKNKPLKIQRLTGVSPAAKHGAERGMAAPIFVALLALVWLIGSYFLYLANRHTIADNLPNTPVAQGATMSAGSFAVQQEGLKNKPPKLDASTSFAFAQSDFSYLTPLNDKLLSNVQALAYYLQDNPDARLEVEGFYEKNEANFSAFPNLGMARANQVKQLFVAQGAPSKQLGLSAGVIDDALSKQASDHSDRIGLRLYVPSTDELAKQQATLQTLAKRLKAKPLVLHFATNQARIELSSSERNQLLDMVRYMDAYPKSTLLVLGHTDNTGDTLDNIVLGQARARRIADFMVANGVPAERVVASSLGELKPQETNDTEAGRKQNRRVEVVVVEAPDNKSTD